MASAAPVVAVCGRRAVPVAEQQRDGRLGQEQHADGGGDDEGEHGAQAAASCGAGRPSVWPVDHCSARSGVTTDMTVTAMMP